MLTEDLPFPNPTSALEAVANGVQFFDTHYPDWVSKIDIDTLELASVSNCVACQVAETYDYINAKSTLFGEFSVSGARYGFDAGHWKGVTLTEAYQQLDEEWKRVIETRRAAG